MSPQELARTNLLLGLIFKLLDVEIRADSSSLLSLSPALWYWNNSISVFQSFFLDFSHNKLVSGGEAGKAGQGVCSVDSNWNTALFSFQCQTLLIKFSQQLPTSSTTSTTVWPSPRWNSWDDFFISTFKFYVTIWSFVEMYFSNCYEISMIRGFRMKWLEENTKKYL